MLSSQKYKQRLSKIPVFSYDYRGITTNLVNRGMIRGDINVLYSNSNLGQIVGVERSGQKPFRPMANDNNSYTQGKR